jgi:hypothetical protein
MNLIKLTSLNGKPIFINADYIGHFYQVPEKTTRYGHVEAEAHTRVGVVTHNNGGFSVAEDVNQIQKLIEKKSKKTVA